MTVIRAAPAKRHGAALRPPPLQSPPAEDKNTALIKQLAAEQAKTNQLLGLLVKDVNLIARDTAGTRAALEALFHLCSRELAAAGEAARAFLHARNAASNDARLAAAARCGRKAWQVGLVLGGVRAGPRLAPRACLLRRRRTAWRNLVSIVSSSSVVWGQPRAPVARASSLLGLGCLPTALVRFAAGWLLLVVWSLRQPAALEAQQQQQQRSSSVIAATATQLLVTDTIWAAAGLWLAAARWRAAAAAWVAWAVALLCLHLRGRAAKSSGGSSSSSGSKASERRRAPELDTLAQLFRAAAAQLLLPFVIGFVLPWW